MPRAGSASPAAVVVNLIALVIAWGAPPASAAPGDRPGDGHHRREVSSATRPCPHHPRTRCGHLRVPLDPDRPAGRTVRLGYELLPRSDRSHRLLGTIVAVEGGPGYSSTDSRSYYRDLFAPLLDRRRLLIVDNRGTGTSGPIRCRQLQSYRGDRQRAIARCGRQLGKTSDLYGTAFAADDLAAVLDHLHIGEVDLYGDSYGTFFGQTFAVRHPDRLRTLILDAAYFVGGTDPWYADTNRALRHAFTVACRRSAPCAQRPGSPMHRIARLADLLRRQPIVGRAPNADGVVRRTSVGVGDLIDLVTGAATTPTLYRELDAAARAALRPDPYVGPLLRLVRETTYVGGAGPVRGFSEGLYVAVSCNDYPQPYDLTASFAARDRQFDRSIRALESHRPQLFKPFTVRDWVGSAYAYYDDCLRWPAPSHWVHPLPRDATFPVVPTLVLGGDLDSLTSPEGARRTARAFPNATFVRTANTTHVSALVDFDRCASTIVRRFVTSRSAGDTSCAAEYHENRLVDRFVRTAADTHWQGPRRRTARVVDATLADAMARWLSMYGTSGVGLRGGPFTVHGGSFTADHPVVRWKLRQVRWVRDVAVTGTLRWHRRSGAVTAHVSVAGRGAVPGRLEVRWNDSARHPEAVARGTLGHSRVDFRFRAS